MKSEIEKLILKTYQLLPKSLQNNQLLISYVSPIAEKRLREMKQEVIHAKWKKVELEQTLTNIKQKQ